MSWGEAVESFSFLLGFMAAWGGASLAFLFGYVTAARWYKRKLRDPEASGFTIGAVAGLAMVVLYAVVVTAILYL